MEMKFIPGEMIFKKVSYVIINLHIFLASVYRFKSLKDSWWREFFL
jgi:hypothetical protein